MSKYPPSNVFGAITISGRYYSLGVVLYKSQQYEESKHYLQKAYDIQEKVLGGDHPDTIKTKDYLELVKKEMEQ